MDRLTGRAAFPAEVRTFSESVHESASKSIALLRAVEETVSYLAWIQNRAQADGRFAANAAEHLKVCSREREIDADGTIVASLEEAENGLQRLYDVLLAKREAARGTADLLDDDREAIIDEYSGAIAAVADLHNGIAELRWAVGEHDADLEKPTGRAFTDPAELRAYLKTI